MVQVIVAVPVRNEDAHLSQLVAALTAQRGAPTFALALFLDGCSDGSATLAATLAAQLPFAVVRSSTDVAGPANAGLARGRACALALQYAPDAAVMTTDADSAPAPDWIARTHAALGHADIVAGCIDTDPHAASALQHRLAAYLDRLHRYRRALDPVLWEDETTHHWTSAASLAFRPGVYRRLDGFAPLPSGEDADLCDRAWRAGLRVRRDARVRVTTSARRIGRVASGFADLLTSLDTAAALPLVAHPRDEAWRYRRHAEARRCWKGGVTTTFAEAVGLPLVALKRIAADVPNAEAFTAHAVGSPPGGMRTVALPSAEAILRSLETNAGAEAA